MGPNFSSSIEVERLHSRCMMEKSCRKTALGGHRQTVKQKDNHFAENVSFVICKMRHVKEGKKGLKQSDDLRRKSPLLPQEKNPHKYHFMDSNEGCKLYMTNPTSTPHNLPNPIPAFDIC